jgi:signal transduction histidine kinase
VLLEYGPEELGVTVRNDGTTLSKGDDDGGHGLIGIRERVAVIGGDVTAGPLSTGGFEVRARLPYSTEIS